MARTWSCPFWKWDDGLKVYCEGARMDFADQEAREEYISRHCANNPGWESCTVAKNLCRKFERRKADAEHRQNQEPGE